MKNEPLIVTDFIEINASKEIVWEILTNPEFIRQWDDVPENYDDGHLKQGSILEWEDHARMTVTEFQKPDLLRLDLFLPKVALPPTRYSTSYAYRLNDKNGKTFLSFEIGDFSPLPEAKNYYDSSAEWVSDAKVKIKELAEK